MKLEWLELFLGFLPHFVRFIGAVLFLPTAEGPQSYLMKAFLALGCAVATPAVELSKLSILSLTSEFFIGMIAMVPLMLVLHVASGCGELIETGRGMTIGQTIDPQYDLPEQSLSQLMRWGTLAYCGTSGLLAQGISPLVVSSSISGTDKIIWQTLCQGILLSLSYTCSLALPYVAIFLFIEWIGGVVSKILPGLSLSSELFAIKGCVCVMLIYLLVITTDQSFLKDLFTSLIIIETQ